MSGRSREARRERGARRERARARFTYPRESRARSYKFTSRGICAVITWESRAVYIRQHPQIYGKYGGFGVLFSGGGSSCLQVSCVVRLPFSLFSLSLFALFPPALCVRLQLQCSSPWTMVVRISLCHSSFLAT